LNVIQILLRRSAAEGRHRGDGGALLEKLAGATEIKTISKEARDC